MIPRLAFQTLQPEQPATNDERELADHDLTFLLEFLSETRAKTYELVSRPDEKQRQSAAPDYLVFERESGRRIAIEHTQLMAEDLQTAKASLIRKGARTIRTYMDIPPGLPASLLAEIVKRKAARGRLDGIPSAERILLLRNRIPATDADTFLRAAIPPGSEDRGSIDHAFLIASRRLLQVW